MAVVWRYLLSNGIIFIQSFINTQPFKAGCGGKEHSAN